ncbi:hypothetical protein [Agromyces subbeticus]|uniref:hypothetical protein n=1 Tax=Agromyces subbeticus TaxID=293890 RepID=UPI0003B491F7|nr:hypothetical protein [Agromyces subbeticus]
MSFSRLAKHPRRCALTALAAGGALVLLLSGCTGGGEPSPTPSASTDAAEPIFATDEEALAAAVAAYTAFEELSQTIAAEGGIEPERIERSVTSEYMPGLLEEFAQYQELGLRITGSASLDSFRLAEHSGGADRVSVTLYVCRDVSGVRVIDAAGVDVTPADRQLRTPLVADLVSKDGADNLLVNGVELWPGDDFC